MALSPTAVKKGNKFLPNRHDDQETRFFKILVLSGIGVFILMGITAIIVILLTLRGPETVKVPSLKGLTLAEACIVLQDKHLVPNVRRLETSSSPDDYGRVLSQIPKAESVVKAGRKIDLVVSKGSSAEKLGNYAGQNFVVVKEQLISLFDAARRGAVASKMSVIWKFDDKSYGTILEQFPKSGTNVIDTDELSFVVSRGAESKVFIVSNFKNMGFKDAVDYLNSKNQIFVFKERDIKSGEKAGIIVDQSPAPDTQMNYGTPVTLTMTNPSGLAEDESFGILTYDMPMYSAPVDLIVTATSENGKKQTIINMKHPGGILTVPVRDLTNTIFTVSINDQEVARYILGENGFVE